MSSNGTALRAGGAPAGNGTVPTAVPYHVYRDGDLYARELERIFYGPSWNYVGLECEVPGAGDFRRVHVGEREVLLLRGADGRVRVLQNLCAHRGAQICQALSGNCGEALTCPYHQWTFDLDGNLTGVPFRRGYRGKGGMPGDFAMSDHGLTRLRCETLNGVVFASFADDVPPLADYMGPEMVRYFTRVFDGRELRVVGYQRQMIDCNWKLQMENLKDPYHAGILHLFLIRFGLFRLDQRSESRIDDSKGHCVLTTVRGSEQGQEDLGDVRLRDPDFSLHDHTLIQPTMEYPDSITLSIQTIFPSLIVQAQSNTLATRHVIPKGVDRHELIWTFFGYAGDDAETRQRRLRQANLMGAAGYVTLDDAEALEFSQAGLSGAARNQSAVLKLGGDDAEASDHLVTEGMIRGFYKRYFEIVGAA